jgi:circadian clock protein KaiC
VLKYRGNRFRGGYHDFVIETGGLQVFPRLVSSEHRREFRRTTLKTGIAHLDKLLGGGVERGSSVLILGPAGAGKSIISLTFAACAVRRGEKVAMFIFDEELGLLLERSKGLGIDLAAMQSKGQLRLVQVDAAELTPGEFSARVRDVIEDFGAKTVIIDSLTGYQAAMPEERALILHMHELLQYCNRSGARSRS